MATTEEILKAAREVGKLIATHAVAQRLEAAVKLLQSDLESQRLLNDFNRVVRGVAEKEARGQPIGPDEKRRLDDLQKQIVRNPNLRQFQMAQMDYLDLMRKVDEAMTGEGPAPAAGTPAGVPGAAGAVPDLHTA